MLTNVGFFLSRLRRAGNVLVLVACSLIPALYCQAQTYNFYTIAGVAGRGGSVDGVGGSTTAPDLFNNPIGLVVDSSGNIFVADSANFTIRKITPAGVVSTFAGTAGVLGLVDGTGPAASFNFPEGPAIDSAGNIFVADFGSNTIRKITPAGVVSTFAGAATVAGSGDGTGTAATFSGPRGVAVDGSGNVYVADAFNNTIRKITSAGVVTTFAGTAGTGGFADGTGGAASFHYPSSVAVDSSGNVYVADTYNHAIRKITSGGVVSTFAGFYPPTGGQATSGHADGTGNAATFDYPAGVAVDSSGNIYVADQGNNDIRKITPAGVVTTLAGPGGSTPAGTPVPGGRVDGSGAAARFDQPTGVAVDSSGNVFVADYDNQLIRKITPAGVVTTLAGAGGVQGSLDGTGFVISTSVLWRPTNVAMDAAGNIYVSDTFNDSIRMITPADNVVTIAGNSGLFGHQPVAGSADGTGTAATFFGPSGIAVDSSNIIYVADTNNHIIRKITPTVVGSATTYVVKTIAGKAGTAGSHDDVGTAATFNQPSGLAVDSSGNLFVTDYNNHTIRRIAASDGTVTTLAGTVGVEGSANGNGTGASFNHPRDVAIDSAGNLYVADTGNHVIREITPSGTVTTIAGTVGSAGSVDGTGTGAKFDGPAGLTVDGAGNIFVVDTNSSTIRKVTPGGVVTTIGGTAGMAGVVDGAGPAARFDHPTGIVVDPAGNLFIADNNNDTIREGAPPANTSEPRGGVPGNPSNPNGSGGTPVATDGINGTKSFMHPGGVAVDSLLNLYIADTLHHSIKKVDSSGTVTTFAGKDGTSGSADGVGTAATFNSPTGIAIGSGNTLYVTDTGNSTIRRVLTDGTVSTLAGSPTTHGSADNTGAAATFNGPTGIVVLSNTDLLVADSGNATIRRVTSAGVVTTEAGAAGMLGDADGVGPAARFNNPTGLGISTSGTTDTVYIADTYNDTVRQMTTDKNVTTLAGSAGISGSYDGAGNYALFSLPNGIGVIASTVVYVADTGNNTVRSISLDGSATVRTLAGFPGIAGAKDGIGTSALFSQPTALAFDSNNGVLYVSDTGNAMIRAIQSPATVFTPTWYNSASPPPVNPVTPATSGGGAMEAWFGLVMLAGFGARYWLGRNVRRAN